MILIVDLDWKQDSLAFNEFVLPIVSVVQPLEACEVKHYLEIEPAKLRSYSKVVLSGTALKDHATLKQVEKFKWIKTCDKPILGICAGMQTISLVFDEPLLNFRATSKLTYSTITLLDPAETLKPSLNLQNASKP